MESLLNDDLNFGLGRKVTFQSHGPDSIAIYALLHGFFLIMVLNEVTDTIRSFVRRNWDNTLVLERTVRFEIFEAFHDPYRFYHLINNRSIAGLAKRQRTDLPAPNREWIKPWYRTTRAWKRLIICFVAFVSGFAVDVGLVYLTTPVLSAVGADQFEVLAWQTGGNMTVNNRNLIRGSFSRALNVRDSRGKTELTHLPSLSVERTDFLNVLEGTGSTFSQLKSLVESENVVNCTASEGWRFKCKVQTQETLYQYKVRLEYSLSDGSELHFASTDEFDFKDNSPGTTAQRLAQEMSERFNMSMTSALDGEIGFLIKSEENGVPRNVKAFGSQVESHDLIATLILSSIQFRVLPRRTPVKVRLDNQRTPVPRESKGEIGRSIIPILPLWATLILYLITLAVAQTLKRLLKIVPVNPEVLCVSEVLNANCSSSLLTANTGLAQKRLLYMKTPLEGDDPFETEDGIKYNAHVGFIEPRWEHREGTHQKNEPGALCYGLGTAVKRVTEVSRLKSVSKVSEYQELVQSCGWHDKENYRAAFGATLVQRAIREGCKGIYACSIPMTYRRETCRGGVIFDQPLKVRDVAGTHEFMTNECGEVFVRLKGTLHTGVIEKVIIGEPDLHIRWTNDCRSQILRNEVDFVREFGGLSVGGCFTSKEAWEERHSLEQMKGASVIRESSSESNGFVRSIAYKSRPLADKEMPTSQSRWKEEMKILGIPDRLIEKIHRETVQDEQGLNVLRRRDVLRYFDALMVRTCCVDEFKKNIYGQELKQKFRKMNGVIERKKKDLALETINAGAALGASNAELGVAKEHISEHRWEPIEKVSTIVEALVGCKLSSMMSEENLYRGHEDKRIEALAGTAAALVAKKYPRVSGISLCAVENWRNEDFNYPILEMDVKVPVRALITAGVRTSGKHIELNRGMCPDEIDISDISTGENAWVGGCRREIGNRTNHGSHEESQSGDRGCFNCC